MLKFSLNLVGLSLALMAGAALAVDAAPESAVTCDDLNWSAHVLEQNPDIAQTCRGVYEKEGRLFALAKIEVVRTRGNTITFRTLHTDGGKGDSRSVTMDSSWRAKIAGRNYRVSELSRGQELNVYMPEDRFALAVEDDDGPDEVDLVVVEEVTAMPTTASPLFLFGLAGGAFLALGALLGTVRRRLS
jgi:hypothetical protein